MEKRLYAMVPYQLTGIQKGIQMQHALTEFEQIFGDDEDYIDWKENWKTTIVLDGGTTNEGKTPNKYNKMMEKGTMQEYLDHLVENEIHVEGFWEPDLNNTLTAFVFIGEEPVFNHEDYPFFEDWMKEKMKESDSEKMWFTYFRSKKPKTVEDYVIDYKADFNTWMKFVGGRKNAILKYFLKGKRLASN